MQNPRKINKSTRAFPLGKDTLPPKPGYCTQTAPQKGTHLLCAPTRPRHNGLRTNNLKSTVLGTTQHYLQKRFISPKYYSSKSETDTPGSLCSHWSSLVNWHLQQVSCVLDTCPRTQDEQLQWPELEDTCESRS